MDRMLIDRKALLRNAMQAAADLRDATGFDQFDPADPYVAAAKLSVKVVFLGASMEGFYFKGPPGRILLSGLRPVPRRAFTCAHELGHHWFGHGSTMDELKEDERSESNKPEEVLANGVAAFFLMPTAGIRGAFARRGWNIAAPTPVELFVVACEFGVGYLTLLNHLSYTLREINGTTRTELGKWSPQRVRRLLLSEEYDSLIVVDCHARAATFDVEKGAAILLPLDARADGVALEHIRTSAEYEVYRAAKRGCASITRENQAFEVRVMPKLYEGPAGNRFLEDPDENN
ncbi:ImmA/IrrE family metallo-endopeptidase [Aminobacter anthyllidis]|uniref:ImmA/IrrE family metallo-endopeptidase n=1 Tax=Aminobacter anthyllidis TaxID=1035067 RepID=A0A9X1AH96_9HYPH|nr:ImmA/IrrE family metallo-endopeptidase [Aminobacter anthyllidis]MBT1159637.1 ImmA/IrrE family metallo-endopeptidase [Aminobacter anthyllidis]